MYKSGAIVLLLLGATIKANAQNLVTNDGLALTIEAGLTATIQGGGFTNQTNGSTGTVDNAGTITLTGDWTNNSANTVFTTNTGLVQFIGTTGSQTIGGSTKQNFTISPSIILSPLLRSWVCPLAPR